VDGGADSSAASKKGGQTPLMVAAQAGFSEIAKLLLQEGGALADQMNSNNATALFYASGMGHAETVFALLDSGADADLLDASGASALMAAVGGGHKAVAKVLLGKGKATVSYIYHQFSFENRHFSIENRHFRDHNLRSTRHPTIVCLCWQVDLSGSHGMTALTYAADR